MEGTRVGTFPGHLSPSFFLLAVTGRGGRPGLQAERLQAPGERQASPYLPQAGASPWAAAPRGEGEAEEGQV